MIKYLGYLCIMDIINYRDLRSNLKHWLDKVVDDMSELVIKRKDQKDLVLISLDEYSSLKETAYLLSGNDRDVLLESINDLESGFEIIHVFRCDRFKLLNVIISSRNLQESRPKL